MCFKTRILDSLSRGLKALKKLEPRFFQRINSKRKFAEISFSRLDIQQKCKTCSIFTIGSYCVQAYNCRLWKVLHQTQVFTPQYKMGKQCRLLLHLSLSNVILTLPFASKDVNHIALFAFVRLILSLYLTFKALV